MNKTSPAIIGDITRTIMDGSRFGSKMDAFFIDAFKVNPSTPKCTHYTVDDDGVRHYRSADGSTRALVGPGLAKVIDKMKIKNKPLLCV